MEIGRFHLVVIIQMVVLNDFYQFGRVGRVGGIACLLQTMGPRLVVCYIIVEQRLIPVSITKEIGVVTKTLIGRAIDTETFPAPVIVMIHLLAGPVMTLDSEMVVALRGQ